MRIALAALLGCLPGCFAYYGFHQQAGGVSTADVTGVDEDTTTTLSLSVTPAAFELFAGETIALTVTRAELLDIDIAITWTAPALTCPPLTLAAGSTSATITCTASDAAAGSGTVQASVVTENVTGTATASYTFLSGERVAIGATGVDVTRGSSSALNVTAAASVGNAPVIAVAIESSDASLSIQPTQITQSGALQIVGGGSATDVTGSAAVVVLSAAGKQHRFPITVTLTPRGGSLDARFSGDGVFSFDGAAQTSFTSSALNWIDVLPSGALIAAGTARAVAASVDQGVVLQLTALGTLDTGFSGDGYQFVQWDAAKHLRLATAARNGSYLFVCAAQNTADSAVIASLDLSTSAVLGFAVPPASTSGCADLTLDATNGYFAHVNGNGETAIDMVNQDTMALTPLFHFDFNGVFPSGTDQVAALAGAGPFFLGGWNDTGSTQPAVVAKVTTPASNQLDASFASSGLYTYARQTDDGSTSVGGVMDLVLQPNGALLGVGFAGTGSALLLRLNASGVLDASFGTNGSVVIAPPAGASLELQRVALDASGRILVAGISTAAATLSPFVMRRLPNGAPDPSFGDANGIVMLPKIGMTNAGATGIVSAANGAVIVAGASGGHAAVWKLWP